MSVPVRPREVITAISSIRGGLGQELLGADSLSPRRGIFSENLDDSDLTGEGEVIEIGEEESSEEECAPRRVAQEPRPSTAQEREDHRIDHLPFRCWCEFCIVGRATGEQHRACPAGSIPTIAFDYLILTKSGIHRPDSVEEGEEILGKILVVKNTKGKSISAHVVRRKGVDEGRFAVERLKEDVLWCGCSKVLWKSDNEPAIVALLKESLKSLKIEAIDQAMEDHPLPITRRPTAVWRMLCARYRGCCGH